MTLEINGNNNGNWSLYCNTSDICVIHCRSSSACSYLYGNCLGTCKISCDESNGIDCPQLNGNVQYLPSPTTFPSKIPTNIPTTIPTHIPSYNPSLIPSKYPTNIPSTSPSQIPTNVPTAIPTTEPSGEPTMNPVPPTVEPSFEPSNEPTVVDITTPPPTTTTDLSSTTIASDTNGIETTIEATNGQGSGNIGDNESEGDNSLMISLVNCFFFCLQLFVFYGIMFCLFCCERQLVKKFLKW